MFVAGVLIITALSFLVYISDETEPYEAVISTLLDVFITVSIWLGAIVITYFLWKKYPWEKSPKTHLLLEIIFLSSWASMVMLFVFFVTRKYIDEKLMEGNVVEYVAMSIIITFLITSIHECVFFYQQWKENFNKSLKLERANLEAKYETLKTQINPHFLFNSLNTLLSYVEENKVASKYVENLSDIMRYVLKSREKEVVLLRDEADIARKYSFIQQSRFGKNLEINIDISEQFYHYSILPLSLQMLIENAIKHNIISQDKKLQITVNVSDDKYIHVENNLQKKFETPSTNLGLANITERYKFLTSKTVKILETSGKFAVSLPLVIVDS